MQVNLTRFNLQFPEKRDFFLEGQGTVSVRRCRLRRQSTGGRIEPQRRVGGRADHLLQPADRAVERTSSSRSSEADACQDGPASGASAP